MANYNDKSENLNDENNHSPVPSTQNEGKQIDFLMKIIRENGLEHLLPQDESEMKVDESNPKSKNCINNETLNPNIHDKKEFLQPEYSKNQNSIADPNLVKQDQSNWPKLPQHPVILAVSNENSSTLPPTSTPSVTVYNFSFNTFSDQKSEGQPFQ